MIVLNFLFSGTGGSSGVGWNTLNQYDSFLVGCKG
jgi:hypothetical protein